MTFKDILKYIVFGGIFIMPFVPLIISGSMFFPFITGKAFAFRIITELIFGAWLILAVKDVSYRPQKSWILYALCAFVGIIALADIFSGHFLKSFWSNFERMEGLVTLLHLLALFFVLTSFIKSELIWDRLLKTSVGASLIIGIRGFLQLFGYFQSTQSGVRLDSSFGNASYLAIYMLFHIFITAYLFSKKETSQALKWVYGLIISFQVFILIFTSTRGAILALVGACTIFLVLNVIFNKENKKVRKISAIALILTSLLIGTFFLTKNSSLVQGIGPLKRLASISLTDKTTISRFLVWDMAFQGFKEKPILGWGQENFIFVFEKYFNPKMYAQEPWFDRAHNIFFDWLVAGGILGLLAYLSIFLASLLSLWKSINLSNLQKNLLISLLAGYFFFNLFVFDNLSSYILFIFILALVHFKSRFKDEELPQDFKPFAYGKIAVPIIMVLTIFSIYFFNVKGILASNNLLKAISTHPLGPEQNLKFFKKALSYNTYSNQEIREQLVNAASQALDLEVDQKLKEEYVSLARVEMQKQIDSNPMSARHQVFMGSFLNRLRLYDEAIPYLERGLELSPKKQLTYFEFVTNYLSRGEVALAFEFSKEAYDLEPEFNAARIIYMTTAIYRGENELVENLSEEKFGIKFYGDERLAKAYYDTRQLDKAILTWKEIIKRNPTNIQHKITLAAIYLEVGLTEDSIGQITEAIRTNPDFKEQGEFFIREIRAGRTP